MSDASYRLLREKAGVIPDLSGIVWVSGPDAVTFLDGLLSQSIVGIEVGASAPSLLLAPNGKLRATLLVLRDADRVGLVADRRRVDAVAADLSRFKIRVDAQINLEERSVWNVWGPDAAAATDVPGIPAWRDDGRVLVVQYPFRHSSLPRVVVAGARPDLPVVEAAAADAVRVEIGEPIVGLDIDDRTIPQEGVSVEATVDFAKGCYLGQELVARIDSRGHVNRRLCGLTVAGETVPEPGTEIDYNGKIVGAITSAAWSDGMASVVGLAMIRVEVGAGSEVAVGGTAGTVVESPIRP